jgi:hypothetical protein
MASLVDSYYLREVLDPNAGGLVGGAFARRESNTASGPATNLSKVWNDWFDDGDGAGGNFGDASSSSGFQILTRMTAGKKYTAARGTSYTVQQL